MNSNCFVCFQIKHQNCCCQKKKNLWQNLWFIIWFSTSYRLFGRHSCCRLGAATAGAVFCCCSSIHDNHWRRHRLCINDYTNVGIYLYVSLVLSVVGIDECMTTVFISIQLQRLKKMLRYGKLEKLKLSSSEDLLWKTPFRFPRETSIQISYGNLHSTGGWIEDFLWKPPFSLGWIYDFLQKLNFAFLKIWIYFWQSIRNFKNSNLFLTNKVRPTETFT